MANEWISAEERYPSLRETVIVWFGNEAEPYMDVWRYDGTNRYFRGKPSSSPHQDVTHWMPLPEPPTQKAGSK